MENQQSIQEDEINLSRYIKVLAKRKITFIAVFLLIFTLGLLHILRAPKIYKVTMIVQAPIVGVASAGKSFPDMSENLRILILNNTFDAEIIKELGLDQFKTNLNFDVSIPTNTNLITVSIDERSEDRELGIKILTGLYNTISKKYSGIIKLMSDEIDNEIKIILNNIASLKENINPLEERLKETTLREEKLYDEIKSVSANTADLVNKRDLLLKNTSKDNEIAGLFYSNSIQLNLGYINQLNNQLADFKLRAIDRRVEIKNLKIEINNYQLEIDKLKLEKQLFSNLKVLKDPIASLYPVSPSKKKSLIQCIFFGFILAASVVFLQEYLENKLKKHD